MTSASELLRGITSKNKKTHQKYFKSNWSSCKHLVTLYDSCFIFVKHTCNATIKKTLNAATGYICDISPMLRFHFWQPFYFNEIDNSLPSETSKVRGRFAGISENFGHDITFKILNSSTNKIIS